MCGFQYIFVIYCCFHIKSIFSLCSADERFDATFHTNVLVNASGSCQYIPPGEILNLWYSLLCYMSTDFTRSSVCCHWCSHYSVIIFISYCYFCRCSILSITRWSSDDLNWIVNIVIFIVIIVTIILILMVTYLCLLHSSVGVNPPLFLLEYSFYLLCEGCPTFSG